MQRRRFLASSAAASTALLAGGLAAQSTPAASQPEKPSVGPREFYQLRRYFLQRGPQTHLTESYFAAALLPALGRLGLGPVGAFSLSIGPETPSYFLVIPGRSVETLATLDLRLAADPQFLEAAQPFWAAPATAPAFLRVESSLLAAFHGWPRLTPPSPVAGQPKRVFQLRTYESPSFAAHTRKIEMFHSGEMDIFHNAGFHPVFFGDTLVGPRLPNLTYMLSFPDMAALTSQWAAFSSDPAWKKLSTSPRFAYEEIVSSITNLVLSPLAASQI